MIRRKEIELIFKKNQLRALIFRVLVDDMSFDFNERI
jgi:hypothetical protein